MRFDANALYHVYNRGNNQQTLFHNDEDYHSFLRYTRQFILPHTHILAWCLMPNHFHFLLSTTDESIVEKKSGGLVLQQLTYGIKQLLSSYTKSFNVRDKRSGNLFQQKTKAKSLKDHTSDYSQTAFFYIHQNPWVAKIVSSIEEWPYSSYPDFIGSREGTIVNKHLAQRLLNINSESLREEIYLRLTPEKEKLIM